MVISGPDDAVTAIAGTLREQGRRVHRLAVSHAFHSSLMDPMMLEFNSIVSGMSVSAPTIPVISNITGDVAGQDFGTADYWLRHVREAVRFADGVRTLSAAGVTRFLEVGPASGLTASVEQTLAQPESVAEPVAVSALRKDRFEPTTLFTALAELSVSGVDVDWRRVCDGGRLVDLPTYAFQRRRFWLSGRTGAADATGLGLGATEHALLGAVVDMPESGGVVLTGRLAVSTQPWLADHAVAGVVLFPGAGFVELAIRAGDEVGCNVVEELMLHAPLVLPPDGVAVQVVVSAPDQAGSRVVSVFSRPDGDGAPWVLHAEGELGTEVSAPGADLSVWPPLGACEIDVADAYAVLSARGYQYGPAFQGLTSMWRRGDEVFAEVKMSQELTANGFGVHPALLDGALHAVVLSRDSGQWSHVRGDGSRCRSPGQGCRLLGAGAVVCTVADPTAEGVFTVAVADERGRPVAHATRSSASGAVSADRCARPGWLAAVAVRSAPCRWRRARRTTGRGRCSTMPSRGAGPPRQYRWPCG